MLATLFVAAVGIGAPLDSPQSQAQQWRTYKMDRLFAKADLPVAPQPFQYQVNNQTRRVQHNVWMAANLSDAYVIFSYTLYYKGDTVDLDEAAKGAVGTLKENIGGKMSTNTKKVTVSGLPARKVYVAYELKGEKSVYTALLVGKERKMWQVIANYPADAAISKSVDRILNSFEILPN